MKVQKCVHVYEIYPNFWMRSGALSSESAQSLLPLLEQRASVHPIFATSPGIAAAVW